MQLDYESSTPEIKDTSEANKIDVIIAKLRLCFVFASIETLERIASG